MTREAAFRWIVLEQLKGRSVVEMPDLIRVHDMPTTQLLPFQQIVNRGQGGTRAARSLHALARTIQLAIPPTLRMRQQRQSSNEIGGFHRGNDTPPRRINLCQGRAGRQPARLDNTSCVIRLIHKYLLMYRSGRLLRNRRRQSCHASAAATSEEQ